MAAHDHSAGTAPAGWAESRPLSRPVATAGAPHDGLVARPPFSDPSSVGPARGARLPVHRRTAVWRNSWSSVYAAPVAAPGRRSAFVARRSAFRRRRSADPAQLPAHGVSQSHVAAARLAAAVLPDFADARPNADSPLPAYGQRAEWLSHSFTIR